jgi:hypothetical protein
MSEQSSALPIPNSFKEKRKKITKEQLINLFPEKKGAITDDLVEMYNYFVNDPEFDGFTLMDSMVANKTAMLKNSASMENYLHAIRFCAYLHAEDNATQAYVKTFWWRKFVQDALKAKREEGTDSTKYKQLTYAASRFRDSPLVKDILTISAMETHLAYMGKRHEALGVLLDRMHNAKLDKDKIAAADMFLKHTAKEKTEDPRLTLNVDINQGSQMQSLLDQVSEIAKIQKKQLESGMSIEEVQKLGLKQLESEVIDVETE